MATAYADSFFTKASADCTVLKPQSHNLGECCNYNMDCNTGCCAVKHVL